MGGDFKLGEWLVSPLLNQISRNGSSTRVEPKSMQVLVYLAEHPGLVTKEQLISAVWPDVFVSDDVLPGCISALRKALDDNARRPKVIETIHKSGYRLMAPVELLERNGNAQPQAPPSPVSWWHRTLVHGGAVGVGLIAVATALLFAFRSMPPGQHYGSIAVLPFIDTDGDSASQFLSDGIAEQVVNNLSQLSSLRVMAWTTVSRYRPQVDVRKLGRDLGVEAVLTGRLLKQGDRMVLNAELVDVRTGLRLWGERYERASADMPTLQEQLSEDIANNLRLRLSSDEQQRMQRLASSSPEAYELYLKGRFFWNKRTKPALDQGIGYFQQAIRVDSHYARAYAGLADCYNLLDDWGERAPRDSFPKAKAAAEKAIALDPSLAEAHTSLAMVRAAYEWDWTGAEQEFRRAIQLNPNYPTAHQWYGLFLAGIGRFKEAEQELRRAQQLDPLSPIINMGVAEVFAWERDYDRAIDQYQNVIRMEPSFLGAYGNLAATYAQKHMYDQAVQALEKQWKLYGDPNFARVIQIAFSRSGYTGVLRAELSRMLQDRARGRYTNPVAIAESYAQLGDPLHAFEWLEKAYQEHSSGMQYLAVSSSFDSIRSSAEFQYWVGVIGLRTPAQQL